MSTTPQIKKNLPESSSHYNYIDLIKKPSTIWLGAVPTTKPVLFYITLKLGKKDNTIMAVKGFLISGVDKSVYKND